MTHSDSIPFAGIEGRTVRINDWDGLATIGDFDVRYLHLRVRVAADGGWTGPVPTRGGETRELAR